jgi:hypothetical protein
MYGLNNMKKGFQDLGELFAICKLVVLEKNNISPVITVGSVMTGEILLQQSSLFIEG